MMLQSPAFSGSVHGRSDRLLGIGSHRVWYIPDEALGIDSIFGLSDLGEYELHIGFEVSNHLIGNG
jgi:hypothetical protein